MASKKEKSMVIEIEEVVKSQMEVSVVGTSPIILNRMSQKAKEDLLMGAKKKNKTEKESQAKHYPLQEYQASPYRIANENSPTLIGIMSTAFKGAMRTAALDLPGSSKAQIGRLVYVEGDLVPIYGVPQIFMSITRSADINKTPDVRTRAIIPKWAATMTISFVSPIIKPKALLNLLAAGGITSGVGDWRPEKGKGDYGQFRIANEGDTEFEEIIATGGREIQIAAISEPEPYDLETEELLSWYNEEFARRGFKVVS